MSTSTDNTQAAFSLLRELRDRDAATGLLTAYNINRILLGEIARSERYGNPLSCILVDISGLSAMSSDVQLQLASGLADAMRTTDHAAVWSEESYLLVLPETDRAGAGDFAGKVKQVLQSVIDRTSGEDGSGLTIATWVDTLKVGDDAEAILGRLMTVRKPQ